MNTSYAAGATSKIVTVYARKISDGLPYTAGAHNTSGLSVTYCRDGATPQTITPVTATAGTYTASGFVHRGKGAYEIGVPNAAFNSGADGVEIAVDGITDVAFVPVRIELLGGDPRSAAIDVNVTQISGDSTAADNLELAYDGTGYAGGTTKPQVNVVQVNGTAQTAGDLAALITTVDDLVDTEVAAIKTVVDGIKTKTDSLTFTQAGHVDANVQRINDVAVTGNGVSPKFAV
jgi:hypothetical protein